jgi:hypothetical protein
MAPSSILTSLLIVTLVVVSFVALNILYSNGVSFEQQGVTSLEVRSRSLRVDDTQLDEQVQVDQQVPSLTMTRRELKLGPLQPLVTVVEGFPDRKDFGSISLPEGSPWCGGRPTFW